MEENIPIHDFGSYKQEAVRRMKICMKCDKYKPVTKQCSLCNCFMPAKVLVPGLHCPDEKW